MLQVQAPELNLLVGPLTLVRGVKKFQQNKKIHVNLDFSLLLVIRSLKYCDRQNVLCHYCCLSICFVLLEFDKYKYNRKEEQNVGWDGVGRRRQ